MSLLPHNSSDFERAFESEARTLMDVPLVADTLWDVDTCPVDLLPYLAWALSVDYWSDGWSETVKRGVIASSVEVHRMKGTPGSIKRALSAIWAGIELSEWFEYGGQRFTFRVNVLIDDHGVTPSEIALMYQAIAATKNARSHLERLSVSLTVNDELAMSAVQTSGQLMTINPYSGGVIEEMALQYFGAVHHSTQIMIVGAV